MGIVMNLQLGVNVMKESGGKIAVVLVYITD
jgi:hypothetical protein